MTPFFSIIIPVYNVAPYLRECLDSVLAQTFADWEAICVDDGSTDVSGVILDEYAARDLRFKVMHQNNSGVGVARNKALSVVSGKWLLFVDGDDVIFDGALSRLSKMLDGELGRFDGVFFTGVHDFAESLSNSMKCNGTGDILMAETEPTDGRSILLYKPYLRGFSPLRMLRKDVFRDVRYPENWPMMEDSIHLMDVLHKKCRWAIVDFVFYGYRRREDSASHQMPIARPMQVMQSINRSLEMAKEYFGLTKSELADVSGRFDDALTYFLNAAFAEPDRYDLHGLTEKCETFSALTGRRLPLWNLRAKIFVFKKMGRPFAFCGIDALNRYAYGVRNRLRKASIALCRK